MCVWRGAGGGGGGGLRRLRRGGEEKSKRLVILTRLSEVRAPVVDFLATAEIVFFLTYSRGKKALYAYREPGRNVGVGVPRFDLCTKADMSVCLHLTDRPMGGVNRII